MLLTLERMGYRLMGMKNGKAVYAKPIGFSLCTCQLGDNALEWEWTCWFTSATDGKICCWSSVTITEKDQSEQGIQYTEAYSGRFSCGGNAPKFGFLTTESACELML